MDATWWRAHFRELREAGVNSTRVWISCDGGNASPGIDPDGHVSAPTEAFWRDLDSLFTIAQETRVYLMLSLISFDHSKPGNRNAEAWQRMRRLGGSMCLIAADLDQPASHAA